MFRLGDFSTERKYPVIEYIYGGPQVSNVPDAPGRGPTAAAELDQVFQQNKQ